MFILLSVFEIASDDHARCCSCFLWSVYYLT